VPGVPERVPLDVLSLTFQKAAGLFMTGGERPGLLVDQAERPLADPERVPDSFADLHAALSVAVLVGRAVDRRLSELMGADWWKQLEVDGDDLAPAVPGFRYVRNAMEHDGADPIGLCHGVPKNPGRRIASECVWTPLEATRDAGEWSYRDNFVGEPIMITLAGLAAVYWHGVLLAEGEADRSGS
jgi:hypothetical protein